MKIFRRRRAYTLFFFIGIASLIYLSFQFLSMQLLNRQNKQELSSKLDDKDDVEDRDKINKIDDDLKVIHKAGLGADNAKKQDKVREPPEKKTGSLRGRKKIRLKELLKTSTKNAMRKPIIKKVVEEREEEEEEVNDNNNVKQGVLLKGILKNQTKLYTPDSNNMFTCLHSKERIPFEEVNDDYCDCDDQSDEPGTSACRNGRFFCSFQLPGQVVKALPSSRVNDGVCDCCDGSDEWKGIHLAKDLERSQSMKFKSFHHVPCPNMCKKLAEVSKEEAAMKKLGTRLKQTYLQAAASALSGKNKEYYGPAGVFYKLSLSCLDIKHEKYEYTVCPFHSVKQQAFPSPSKSLGRMARWESTELGDYRLRMYNGDAELCPVGTSRNSLLFLTCGLQDQLLSVREDQRCEYHFKMTTPAAC